MNSQTARRPEDKATTTRPSHSKRYRKQTASHVEARRDGKPLIFKWGGNLTRSQKIAVERIAVWSTIGLIALLIFGVFGGFWFYFNITVPNEPIVTFMGHAIPQSEYHEMVAVHGQLVENTIKGKNGLTSQLDTLNKQVATDLKNKNNAQTTVTNLQKQIKNLTASQASQKDSLESQLKTAQSTLDTATTTYNTDNSQAQTINSTTIPNQENTFTQSQIGNDSGQWLEDDILIRNWLSTQSQAIQNKINPSQNQINHDVANLIRNLPTSKTYSQFLSGFNVSDSNVHDMMAVLARRDNLMVYAQNMFQSPTKQIEIRDITVATASQANTLLKQLKANNNTNFATLAKNNSLDTNSKSKGGELGWFAQGQYTLGPGNNISTAVDNWLFDQSHTVGENSTPLLDNGTYHIINIEAIDNSKPLSDASLLSLKNNALTWWLLTQLNKQHVSYGQLDSTKLLDSSNMPSEIPSSAPTQLTPTVAATS